MKKLFVGLFSISVLLLQSMKTNSIESLQIGAALPKPDLLMKDVSGKDFSLLQKKNKNGLLVMFSCNACPVVHANQSRTKEICKYALDNQIGVAVINSNEGGRSTDESFEAMQSYAKEQSYQWSYLLDKNHLMADVFGANRTPECFLFDKDNKLVYHGAIDDSPGDIESVTKNYLRQAISEMTSGKTISVKETRSIGCSIFRG